MPVPESAYVVCLDCQRGPKATDKRNQCSCGWQARTRKTGCYSGDRIPGTKAKKGEQGFVTKEGGDNVPA
jgi:hypothetical protein